MSALTAVQPSFFTSLEKVSPSFLLHSCEPDTWEGNAEVAWLVWCQQSLLEMDRKQRRKERMKGRKGPGTQENLPLVTGFFQPGHPHHLMVTETPQIASPAGDKAPNPRALAGTLKAWANCASVLFWLFYVTKTVHGTAVCDWVLFQPFVLLWAVLFFHFLFETASLSQGPVV